MKWITTASLLTLTAAGPLAAQTDALRSQFSLEASPTLAGAITYAHRTANPHLLLGLGGGFAWELNEHSFERHVWNVIHFEGFARYEPAPWLQADLGLSVASTAPGDDTSEHRAFMGLYGAAMIGYRPVFFGPQVRYGWLDSEVGWIRNFAIRVALPVGG